MEFLCVSGVTGPGGQVWFQGEVYRMTRRDLEELQAAGLTANFEPVNDSAQSGLLAVETLERNRNDQ